jgi:hypothetical protein
MSYVLRLFDVLNESGITAFREPRRKLWTFVQKFQLPDLDKEAVLWGEFFEDHDEPSNRTAWAPLNLARYLVERKEQVDPNWKADAKKLIDFVTRRFTSRRFGVLVCGEQDEDKNPWGGILSTYGGVLAMYAAATDSGEYKEMARQALALCTYFIDEDGCPRDSLLHTSRGGWQEDAHTDVVHNFVDAMTAFPEWK